MADEITTRLLKDAGLGPGMRVADMGCGRGDVSVLAARLVGEHGRVLGIDRDADALAVAEQRASEQRIPNVRFVQGDFPRLATDHGRFDAVVARRVLMYQPDALASLRHVVAALEPGGIAAFQEHDSAKPETPLAELPLHAQVHRWIWTTVEREGADIHMGFKLASLLEQAGLVVQQVRAEAIVQTPRQRHDLATIVRAMLPRIVRHGVASEHELALDSLDRCLAEELDQAGTAHVADLVFCVWARKPAVG